MTVRVTYGRQPAPPVSPQAPVWGWYHLAHPDETIMEVHVMPASDVAGHLFGPRCLCRPVEDPIAPDFWQHNAFDGREDYETGRRKKH